MTRTKTLSQSFDIGDFIAPDILSVVDASVRASAADILDRGGLVDDIERIIDLRTAEPRISDISLGGQVPSMNPDEFMSYDLPKEPVMTGFDFFEPAAEMQPSIATEIDGEAAIDMADTTEAPVVHELEPVEIDVMIPDLGIIEQTAALVQDDIVVEIPEVSGFSADQSRVKWDTLRFDKKFRTRVRIAIIITIIVVVEAILIIYLLTA